MPPAFFAEALDIRKGECLALVGPNGSGKTTLLKALNGLLAPQAGSLLFLGEPAAGSAELRRRSVYLHQSPYILAGSVSYNVLYGARARGLEVGEAHGHARAACLFYGRGGVPACGFHSGCRRCSSASKRLCMRQASSWWPCSNRRCSCIS